MRLIRNPSLLQAHEQLVLGRHCCWTGDMLRRSGEERHPLSLVEENAPAAISLAQSGFKAIWAASQPVPPRWLSGPLDLRVPEPRPSDHLKGELAPLLLRGGPARPTRH
jgi:hypothetical protein